MVRIAGVASAATVLTLGVAGSAFACNAGDFTSSVTCVATSGQAEITLTDHNDSTPLTVTVYANKDLTGQIGSPKHVNAQGEGHTAVVDAPWQTANSWWAYVVPDTTNIKPFLVEVKPGTGDCAAPVVPTSSAPTSKAPTSTPPTSAPATNSTPTPTPTGTGTVEPTASPSPTGPVLATTGGGSGSGMIAGVAGAFVLVGAGAVFALRRRSSGGHR
jgi:hypothetical protein